MTRRALLVAACLMAVALASPLGAQCSMCKTALINSEEGRHMAEGLNHGILLMIAAPYLVFGAIGAMLFRERLRAVLSRFKPRRRHRATASLPLGLPLPGA
jgi:ABC-type phosphate transport system permease subunit